MEKQEKNELKANFSSRIKEAIAASGLKQKELAKRIGISEITLSRYVSGTQEPSRGYLFLLASHLNVAPSWLAGDDNEELAKEVKDKLDDNQLPEDNTNWKRRALAAEERLQRIETILRELFAFARIGQ